MRTEMIKIFVFCWIPFLSNTTNIYIEESDTDFFFTCPFSIPNHNFQKLEVLLFFSNQENVVFCKPCVDVIAGVSYEQNSTDYSFTIKLPTQLSVLRTFSSVTCRYDVTDYIIYNVIVTARPQNGSCDPPFLANSNTVVSLTCRTTKVYPQAACEVNVRSLAENVSGNKNSNNTMYTMNFMDYYTSVCTWTSNLSNFLPGNYSFSVTFHPILNESRYSVNVMPISFLNLSLPRVLLSKECLNSSIIVDGYVKPGTTVNCVCFLDDVGYPPSNVIWLDSNGKVEGSNFNSTATLLALSVNQTMTYTCNRISHLRNGNDSIMYTIKNTKGPSSCNVTFKQTTLNLCYNKYIDMSIQCEVSKSDVSPGIKTSIYINSNSSTILDGELVGDIYTTRYETTITQAGNYNISCLARNSIFGDIAAFCFSSQIIQVTAPPSKAPNLYIQSDVLSSQKSFIEDRVYIVTCSVDDGVPPVSNITVSCGNITAETLTGNVFTAAIKFSRNMTGQNCTCTAQHISGCYINNTSHLPIQVAFVSTVTNFRSQNSATFVKNGTWTEMVCEADGYPSPKISILKGNDIVIQIPSGHFISFSKVLSCKDSGIYVCQTDNEIYAENLLANQSQVTVFWVLCPLQPNNVYDLKRDFKLQLGEKFSYSFDVFGYPFPKSFNFFKFDKKNNVSVQINFNDLGNRVFVNNIYKIRVSYSANELPYGMIEIILFNLSISDFTDYKLVVNQNGFNDLEYTFNITEGIQMPNTLSENDVNIAAAVGGSLAAFVMIIVIAVGVFINRKYTITIRKKKHIQNKTIHNYSDLTVSQHSQDRHNYETPNINPEARTANRKTNYVNVLDGNKEDHPYDQITNEV